MPRVLTMKRLTAPLLILIVGTALVARAAATAPMGADYVGSSLDVNRSGDAVQALGEGNFARFFETQPAIGPVSIVVRAPFAAAAGISHDLVALPESAHGVPPVAMPDRLFDSQLRLYRWGTFPCMLALVLLAAAAAAMLARRGQSLIVQLITGGAILLIPLWHNALTLGHPEEFLTTALTFGALLAAVKGRVTTAGVLFGIALASKQWAILALPALALAVQPQLSRRVVVASIATFVALMIPMAIGDPDRFAHTLTAGSTASNGFVGADTLWFPLAPEHDVRVYDGLQYKTIPRRDLSHAVKRALHPLIVLIAALLAFALWRRRGRLDVAALFQLLALVFLLRCMLDPVSNGYYHAPFLVALALYEGFSGRPPILAVAAGAAFLPRFGIDLESLRTANAIYLAWSIPLAGWLAYSLFARKRQPLRPKL
jgi:Glycosyltransferase family 87